MAYIWYIFLSRGKKKRYLKVQKRIFVGNHYTNTLSKRTIRNEKRTKNIEEQRKEIRAIRRDYIDKNRTLKGAD